MLGTWNIHRWRREWGGGRGLGEGVWGCSSCVTAVLTFRAAGSAGERELPKLTGAK